MTELPLHWPVPPGDLVLVGVSGGPDSVALLHRLHATGQWPLIACHLDHGWRAQSESDAAYVADLCQSLGVPLHLERQVVPRQEAAARKARLDYFRRLAEEMAAPWVAVAHTADDQAETILMRLIRGTVKGLGGMRRERPLSSAVTLVRPWLHLRRHQVVAYCDQYGLTPRLDPTNQDPAFFRNRVRLQLLPLLVAENPQFIDHLGQLAEVWQDDNDFLEAEALAASDSLMGPDGALSVRGLLSLPVALQRRIIVQQLQHPSLEQVHAVLRLAQSGQGSGETPESYRSGDRLWLGPRPIPPEPVHLPLASGLWAVPEAGWQLTVTESTGNEVQDLTEICLDADQLQPDACFRFPEAGDRFRPEGGAGSTPLAKYLGGLGLSKPQRERTLVLAQGSQVLWVVGLRRGQEALATPQSRRIIKVSATRPG